MSKIFRIPHFQLDYGTSDSQVFIKPINLFGHVPVIRFSRYSLDDQSMIQLPLKQLANFRTDLYEIQAALEGAIYDRKEKLEAGEDD